MRSEQLFEHWWSGLRLTECRRGTQAIASELIEARRGTSAFAAAARKNLAHLVPSFDGYLVAYRDRSAVHLALCEAGAGLMSAFERGSRSRVPPAG